MKKNSKISREPAAPDQDRVPPAFTYLTNHSHVLVALDRDPSLRVRDLALLTGITERAVQRIIADLVRAGVLTAIREGRRNRYRIERESHLRHPLEGHCTVGGLLTWVRRPN